MAFWANQGSSALERVRALKSATPIRVSTGALAAATTSDVTVTWATPFADTNYTVVATVEDSTASLDVRRIKSKTTTAAVVSVRNSDAINARTGTLHVVAVAD